MRERLDRYVQRGWAVIPVHPRSKQPIRDNWPELRLQAKDLATYFPTGEENIGVLLGEPSDGLIDIDLDSAEAICLAPEILPPTCRFGRENKPESHYLYCVDPSPATQRFSFGPDTLLELRSTGSQTVFPGSVHHSGEPIEFDSSDELITVIDPDELILRTSVLAVMSLWQANGQHSNQHVRISPWH